MAKGESGKSNFRQGLQTAMPTGPSMVREKMEEAGWALDACAWSKRDSTALFQSVAIMEECQASKS